MRAPGMLASMRGVSPSLVLLLTLRACHSRTRRVSIVFDPPYLCNNATGFGVGCRGSAATPTHRVPTVEGDGAACTVTSVLGCYDLPGLSFVALLHDRNNSFDQNACAELCCHDGHTGGVFAVGIHAKTHGAPWSSVGGNCYCAANFAPPAKTLRPMSECNIKCAANASQMCGGAGRIVVGKAICKAPCQGVPPPPPPPLPSGIRLPGDVYVSTNIVCLEGSKCRIKCPSGHCAHDVPNSVIATRTQIFSNSSRATTTAVVANANDYPQAGEGPNENAIALMSDNRSVVAVVRLGAGDYGGKYFPYLQTISSTQGRSWSKPKFIDAGCADPQLLRIGGSLVLSGGRYISNGTSDVLLWLNADGMATSWERHSISAVHNRLEKDPALRFTAAVNSSRHGSAGYTSLALNGADGSGNLTYHDPATAGAGAATFTMRFHLEYDDQTWLPRDERNEVGDKTSVYSSSIKTDDGETNPAHRLLNDLQPDPLGSLRAPTEPQEILQGKMDWAAFLSRSDPINTFNISEPMTVPDTWLEGSFLGNGMIGCQVLVCPGGICAQSLLLGTNTTLPSLDAPHQLVIPLARADVVDTRTGNASAACTEFHGKVNCFNLADQYARPRLGIGALILRQTSGTIIGGSIRTHLHNASISAMIRTTQGDVEFNVFIHATRQLLVVQGLRGRGGERHTQLRFDFVPAPAVSPVQFEEQRAVGAFTRFTGSPLPGHYKPNPPVSCSDNSCRQSLLVSKEGRGWVTSWRSGSDGQLLLTVTSDIPVRVGIAPKITRASTEATAVLAAAVALDHSSLVAEHSSWWSNLYWSDSSGAFVSLPAAAAKVEQFHWITLLKVASENACRRFVDSAFPPGILDNCLLLDGLNFVGPMQKTKYPFAIWDMNVEGAQWGSHSSNLPEQSLALARRIPEQLSNFIASVPRDMRNDSASINVETASLSFLAECMVQHCDTDAFPLCVRNFSAVQDLPDEVCLQHSGSQVRPPQNFYGGLPWICHNIWLVYRHTMDVSILHDLIPLLKRATNLYMRTAYTGADEKVHLPLMESPEYGEAADTSFDHALFRWCLRTLIHTSTLLPNSSTDREVKRWQNTLHKLSAPRIDPVTGSLMIGANLSLHSPNKHFSHLFSVFPLGLQDWSVEAERQLWTKSLAVFKHYNDPTVSDEGFTYLGMAIITAWARPALPSGAPLSWADSVLGNISHFFSVPQLGSGTMYADHAACGPVAGCREGMAGPCNESPILASLALQHMLLQSWNGVPIGIFPAVPASWADARFARMRAEGAVLVTAVRTNFSTIFFSLNATVGGNVSVHSTIVDLVSSSAEVVVTARSGGNAGVFTISVSHAAPWAAVFYSKARGPPSLAELGLAVMPLSAGEANLWGSRPAGSGPPIPPGPPPPGPLGPLPPCPASGSCVHCGGCKWPYANNTLPDPKQPFLSSLVATTLTCETKCESIDQCAGFSRKDAESTCFFYLKSQVSGLFSHSRPDVSWHPNPRATVPHMYGGYGASGSGGGGGGREESFLK